MTTEQQMGQNTFKKTRNEFLLARPVPSGISTPCEGHFGVKTTMAAILKGRSKPKCSKLATSNWRAHRNEGFLRVQLMDTSGSHDPLRRFFPWWWRLRVATGWWRRRALQETVVWSPTPFITSKLSLRSRAVARKSSVGGHFVLKGGTLFYDLRNRHSLKQ